MLGNGGENVDGEAGRFGHIDGDEINIAFHQAGNEMDVAGEAVELSDDEFCFLLAAKGEGGGELGPVVLLAAFYFREFLKDRATSGDELGDGLALCVEAQAAFALLVGGDPIIGHIISHGGSIKEGMSKSQRVV